MSGLTKESASYDQLSVTQWVAGFGQTMRDESDPEIRQHMLEYKISLLDFGKSQSRSVIVSYGAGRCQIICRYFVY